MIDFTNHKSNKTAEKPHEKPTVCFARISLNVNERKL